MIPRDRADAYKAQHDPSVYTRERAIRHLPYPKYRRLLRAAARRGVTMQAAIQRLDPEMDNDILRAVVTRGNLGQYIRSAAVHMLVYPRNRVMLRWLAKEQDWLVREAAVMKLSRDRDMDVIEDRLRNDGRWRVRYAALERLDPVIDVKLLEETASGNDQYIRDRARGMLDAVGTDLPLKKAVRGAARTLRDVD